MEGMVLGDEEVPPDGICRGVYHAVQLINVDEKGQPLDIRGDFDDDNDDDDDDTAALDGANAQFIVDFLQQHPNAVNRLSFTCFSGFTSQAVEILRTFLSETTNLQKFMVDDVNLGNEKGGRLLSGLHRNESVSVLLLINVGFGGATSGRILADLLRNNSYLKELFCDVVLLGLEGARALQPALRTNQTLSTLSLCDCGLGDEGLSVLVDGLNGNETLKSLVLMGNNFTSHGFTHLTRLLELNSLECLDLDGNPHLFDNEQNTKLFSHAISQNNKLRALLVSCCEVSGPVMSSLFRAVATNTKLKEFSVYDDVRMQGRHLDNLLAIIPRMLNLSRLEINLDFDDKAVLAAFHRNSSIGHLYSGNEGLEEITAGPIMSTLERNRLLFKARQLLGREPRHMIPLGLWSKGIKQLTRDNTGATAAYQILREKLVMWWLPSNATATSTIGTAVAAAVAATGASNASSSNKKRSRAQDPSPEGDIEETDAKRMHHGDE